MNKRIRTLTAQDLLAAPDRDYMNPAQRMFFRQRLIAMRDELNHHFYETEAHLREVTAAVDPLDRATQEEEQTIELRTRERERKLSLKIEQALARIDAGTYGFCEETGEPIGIARLLARPTATLTLEAQERHEHLERVHGH